MSEVYLSLHVAPPPPHSRVILVGLSRVVSEHVKPSKHSGPTSECEAATACKVPFAAIYYGGSNASRGKPEGKRPLGRLRRRWEDNIKMDLQDVGGGGDWMELAQYRYRWRALVNTVMNFRVP